MERVQRRALRIISRAGRRDVPELPTLQSRREDAAVKLFRQMLQEDHPLHDLVPVSRANATGRSLRNKNTISIPPARTKRLQNSFLHQSIRLYNQTVALNAASPTSVYSLLDVYSLLEVNGSRQCSAYICTCSKNKRSPSGSRQEPARDLTAARPNCKSRSAPYHRPHGSRRATDRAPDWSLTETGRKIRRTLGVMTPAGVYAEDMPNGRSFKSVQNIASGEEGAIFRPGKVHPRSTNAQSKFGIARRKFVDAWVR
ncbi:hypothetical protein Bbelb_081070 [Branchiostoma belcheri]|nr:hypothetical protein Bbelb_081070 [Branchiostoma belcheri]